MLTAVGNQPAIMRARSIRQAALFMPQSQQDTPPAAAASRYNGHPTVGGCRDADGQASTDGHG